MMEDSSEAHMETDVSSTTEDVPGTQEVSGSNGNVDMIVIVEKVSDDESSCSDATKDHSKKQSSSTDHKLVPDIPNPPQPLPQVAELQPPMPEKSPSKHTEAQKSPTTQEHSCNKEALEIPKDTPSPSLIRSEEAADSSPLKVDVQKSSKKNITPKKQSPVKEDQGNKTPQVSPMKEQLEETKKPSPQRDTALQETSPAINGNVENENNILKDDDSPQSTSVQIVIEKEPSEDSQPETNSDLTEKEHNKSISRELKSLIKSAKESKIISECTQLTTKTRKSRAPLDSANTSLNVSVEADKIQDVRRSSSNSQKSNCSEKAEKVPVKRSMRSQNPEFVNKVKQFLNSVTSKVQKESDEGTDDDLEETKVKDTKNESSPYVPKKKKVLENVDQDNNKLKSDPYCWRCHWAVEQVANEKTHPPLACTVCPRAFHYKCLSGVERSKISPEKSWVCPECMAILHAESLETRSQAMKKISLATLCELLTFAVERIMDLNGVEPFMAPVDRTLFPDYDKYVVHPMDLLQMKANIADAVYGSTEAFIADAQWILHNSIIFNTFQSKLTAAARTLVRSCRLEMGEIEACPECYAAAHARKPTWFTDVCTTPHMLLWAKLKGFPYWPAKGMSVNNSGLVDVRFFGAHDRAWVPAKDCFLYSEKDPNNFRTKRQDILDSMQEAEQHIRNISRKYGKFVYPPFKTQFDPSRLTEQLKMMIPSFEGEVKVSMKEKPSIASPSMVKDKRCSKSSKSSHNEGEASDTEEGSTVTRKMADGADIARIEEDTSEKDKPMEVDPKPAESEKPEKPSRKRRRSQMEEVSVMTVMERSTKEKKKKIKTEDEKKVDIKEESQSSTASGAEEPKNTPTKVYSKTKSDSPQAKSKGSEQTNGISDKEKNAKLTPIRLVISTNQKRVVAKTTGRGSPKVLPIRIKQTKLDKSIVVTKTKSKDEKTKQQKRRNSKGKDKSMNIGTASVTTEKKDEENKNSENTVEPEKNKDKKESNKQKEDAKKSSSEQSNTPNVNAETPKTGKERPQFDDNTSLAELARGSNRKGVTNSNVHGLPTISCVRSLSTTAQDTSTTTTKTTTPSKMIEVTIEPNSLLTPMSSSNVQNVKETTPKTAEPSMVGRVGVRAFARLKSPETEKNKKKEVEVEIKAEPMDFEDQERQMEKVNMMKTFKLRPVNQVAAQNVTSLREVRINKVVMTPLNARKTATKAVEVRPRARKTFPQPKKPDDGRNELNSKNSMVYIPIQPPMTPGPLRVRAPVSCANGPMTVSTGPRPMAPIMTTSPNNIVNTVTTPLVPSSVPPLVTPTSLPLPTSSMVTNPLPLVQVGQVPTTVHRVPLITSVNGQWTFSLQPIMSVGGGMDDSSTPPLLNGLPERPNPPMTITPLPPASTVPAIIPTPTVVPVPGPPVIVTNTPNASNTANVSNTVNVTNASNSPVPALTSANNTTPNSRTPDSNTANPGEFPQPPRLQQRPVLLNPLDSLTPIGNVPPPSSVGPVTAKLNQNAVKLTDFFRTLLEDSLEKLDDPATQVTTLKLQSEQMAWRHQQEIEEMKHNHELVLAEMRASYEKEKARMMSEMRRVAQTELEAAVKQAKAKQWCANCYQEAQFYCCWNTSYCDYPCQRAHWAQHYAVCTQQRDTPSNPNEAPGSRLQPQPENIPKCTTAPSATPTLTVGGKIAQARAPTNQDAPPTSKSSSIIMSMVEDKSGNQTMKCVGVYKPSAPAVSNQISPIVQMPNNEENATTNKMMTSGGYLIVGGNTTNQVTTPPRRAHTIQYHYT
ncbi:protein kinase C-binding protein 1-like isoform X3 [Ostrinia furnacalis]|uniref:protein kinase C-binding protein 1-like isoform X3 n=1 Tax=Ostrinia furnacalis TaxID=93504 RepID=UPI00103E8020|nr:protein kinase C-binding protein 1-like isoform X3 [Ostrinia furnacalis]